MHTVPHEKNKVNTYGKIKNGTISISTSMEIFIGKFHIHSLGNIK